MLDFLNSISLTIVWSKFIDSNYWLSPSPFEDSGYWPIIVLLLILLAIYTVLMAWRYSKLKRYQSYQMLRKGLIKSTIFVEIFMLIWLFFRTQSIYLLSNRLIGASIILLWLIWIGWILYYKFKIMPNLLFKEIEQVRKQKYLPKNRDKK